LSGTAGALVYAVLCKIWPVQIYPTERQSTENTAWEAMVPTEGFFHDDETMPEYIKNKVLFGVEPTTTVSSEEENVPRGRAEEKKRPSAV
jgi:NCS1 family nucleobase:cation symporter-1